MAQFIRRREYWVVKWRDWTMKLDLLRMLEWHARATRADVNTWLLGKRVRDWADEASLASIRQIWAPWAGVDLWRALLEQVELFSRLSNETCAALAISYDDATEREIQAYIRRLCREDQEDQAAS